MNTKFIAGLMLTVLFVTLLGLGIQKVLRTDGEYALDQERQRLELERLALETSAREAVLRSPHYILVQTYGSYILFFGVLSVIVSLGYMYRSRFERLVNWTSGDTQTQITQRKAEELASERMALAKVEAQERVCELIKDMQQGRLQEVRQILSISSGKLQQALPGVSQSPTGQTFSMPSFQDLLTSVTDKKMILGYERETNEPYYLSLKKDKNLIFAGPSGVGKTSDIRLILSQGIQSNSFDRVLIADEHMTNEEGLTQSLGELANHPQVETCKIHFDLAEMIDRFHKELIRRIDKQGTWNEVWLLVCDEGLHMLKRVQNLEDCLFRAVTEARKYGMYVMFAAQIFSGQKVPTFVRDAFHGIIIHKSKPLPARTLLQDKDQARLCTKLYTEDKKWSEVLYAPQNGKEVVLRVPYVSRDDMDLLTPHDAPVIDIPHETCPIREMLGEDEAREKLRELRASGKSWGEIASLVGRPKTDRGNLSKMVRDRAIPDDIREKLTHL
jgi:hypothetical protein